MNVNAIDFSFWFIGGSHAFCTNSAASNDAEVRKSAIHSGL
ncbi:hypothetical protein [Mesorhizobium sp. 128a]